MVKRQLRLVMLSIGALLLSSCNNDSKRYAPDDKQKDEGTQASPESSSNADPSIVLLGKMKLRIPPEVWSTTAPPGTPRNLLVFSVFWHDGQKIVASGDEERRVRIALQVTGDSVPFPLGDGGEVVARMLKNYIGPVDTDDDRVKKYSRPRGGADAFVITELDPSGRYPVARCDSIACRVHFVERPALAVTYRLYTPLVENWVEIDQAVRALVASFVLEE